MSKLAIVPTDAPESSDDATPESLPLVVHRGRRGWDDRWGQRIGPPLAIIGLAAVIWSLSRNTNWLDASLTRALIVGGLMLVFAIIMVLIVWWSVRPRPERRLHVAAGGWRVSNRSPADDAGRRLKRWPGRSRFVHHRGDGPWSLDLVHHPTPTAQQPDWWNTLTAVPPRTLATLPGRPTRRMMREVRAAHALLAEEGLLSGELDLEQPRVCPGCGYDLRGALEAVDVDAADESTRLTCSECGFTWQLGDIVLVGNPGLTWDKGKERKTPTGFLASSPAPLRVAFWVILQIAIGFGTFWVIGQVLPTRGTSYLCFAAVAAIVLLIVWQWVQRARSRLNREEIGSKRGDDINAGEAAMNWAGACVLRMTADGVAQHRGLRREPGLWAWNELTWKVQQIAGGVRVVGWRRNWLRCHSRPVDFILPVLSTRDAARLVRRTIRRYTEQQPAGLSEMLAQSSAKTSGGKVDP